MKKLICMFLMLMFGMMTVHAQTGEVDGCGPNDTCGACVVDQTGTGEGAVVTPAGQGGTERPAAEQQNRAFLFFNSAETQFRPFFVQIFDGHVNK